MQTCQELSFIHKLMKCPKSGQSAFSGQFLSIKLQSINSTPKVQAFFIRVVIHRALTFLCLSSTFAPWFNEKLDTLRRISNQDLCLFCEYFPRNKSRESQTYNHSTSFVSDKLHIFAFSSHRQYLRIRISSLFKETQPRVEETKNKHKKDDNLT